MRGVNSVVVIAVHQLSSYLVRPCERKQSCFLPNETPGRLVCQWRTWNAVDDTPPPSACQRAAAAGAAPTDRNAVEPAWAGVNDDLPARRRVVILITKPSRYPELRGLTLHYITLHYKFFRRREDPE